MRRTWIVGTMMILSALLPVSASGETVFHLDSPPDGATVAGIVEVSGWILDDGEECGPPPEWQTCDWSDALVSTMDLYVDGVLTAGWISTSPATTCCRPTRGTPAPPSPGRASAPPSTPTPWWTAPTACSCGSPSATAPPRTTASARSSCRSSINQAPFGEIEMPGNYQPMNGVFPVTGWALDDGQIEDIEVMVDGLVVGRALTGVHRPDIDHRFPWHPDAEYAGWVRMLNTTELTNGVHIVAVRLRDNEGATRVIGRRYVQTFNVGYNLPPFGGIDWPIADHYMYAPGCSEPGGWSTPPYEDPLSVELVSGWALDVGSSTDRGGVKWVEILIDGSLLANTLVDDFYYDWFEMDVNYYGHERNDILRLFTDVPNAKHSGFTFVLDISDLIIRRQFHQGLHYLKIRAGDIEGNVADIAQIPVIFDCNDDPDRPSFGDIYTPTAMERVMGTTPVAGWAVDFDHIVEVEIRVDGDFMGFAAYGIPTPELREDYPWYPFSLTNTAGFYYDLDTTLLTDGEHVLTVRTRDYWGGRNYVGERTFVVDNLNMAR